MKNPDFDYRYVTLADVMYLQRFRGGKSIGIDTPMVKLMLKKLLEMDGNHALRATLRGEWAMNGMLHGSQVRVTRDYKLPQMHGKIGTIVGINDNFIDADGIDEYGYVIKRAKPSITVNVKFDDCPGQEWCFYNISDLEAVWFSGVGIDGHRNSR